MIPHHLHPLVYLLWNPSPASHPVVDRVVHKGLVECSVAVDMLSIKQAMHKMAHRTATRHASQVNAYLNPSVSAVPVTTSSASSGYAAAAAAAAAATAATTGAATAPELLPPKKRGRKNQPKSEEYGDAQENKGHVRFTAEHVLLSSFEEAVEVSSKSCLKYM
ncbi:hypothetical protein EON65_16480 [archaeon]|nr:MAG: hypothetical protein EON65_16480 [archaeon]